MEEKIASPLLTIETPPEERFKRETAELMRVMEEIQNLFSELVTKSIIKKDIYEDYFNTYIVHPLIKKYGDREVRKYLAFHALIGSTPRNPASMEFDFSNNSIVHFVNNKLKEYKKALSGE